MRGATAGVLLLCLGSAEPQCRLLILTVMIGAVTIMVLQFGEINTVNQYCDKYTRY